jgi:hypothetical protein
MDVIIGPACLTVNALARATVSGPVITWIPCTPNGAVAAIATGTVRLVAVAAVGAPAVTPVPLKVTAELRLKCVKFPVMVTASPL